MRADPRPVSGRKALIVTYTFANPFVVGVFFRAIRLAKVMRDRGWTITIWNFGPMVDDPKVQDLGDGIEIRNDIFSDDVGKARRQFRSAHPDVVIFGEAPFHGGMRRLWEAAAMLGRPFVLMEQYYDQGTPGDYDVDLMLLYGLKCFWGKHGDARRRWTMVSPFIGEPCSPAQLPMPAPPEGAKRITILGFERMVLEKGMQLVATLPAPLPQVVTVGRDPAEAAQLAAAAGIPETRVAALPLQSDAVLYGLLHSSAAAIVANGFMQIMESLAMCCPAICIERGVGMWPMQLHESFQPFACFSSDAGARGALERWLQASPFDADLREKLLVERDGAMECASHIGALVGNAAKLRIRARQAKYMARYFGAAVWRWVRPQTTADQIPNEGTPA